MTKRKFCKKSADTPIKPFVDVSDSAPIYSTQHTRSVSVNLSKRFVFDLPKHIRVLHVDLKDQQPSYNLVFALSELPSFINALDFRHNKIGERDFLKPPGFKEWCRLISDLPTQIKALGLGSNAFRNRKGTEFAALFAAIPEHITFFDFANNHLGDLRPSDLVQALSALPNHIVSLDLSRNALTLKNNFSLSQVLRALPDSLKELNLNWNCSDNRKIGVADLVNLFRELPSSLERLGLGGIDFADQHAQIWRCAFELIPNVTLFLSVEQNCFDKDWFFEVEESVSV